mmetsp:Transcript_30970/g.47385  ORF Transcript_30970/g.47385 Transcript_30970/m.47385 type:complete len:106 (+) Transcript_30970:1278-1595(+)
MEDEENDEEADRNEIHQHRVPYSTKEIDSSCFLCKEKLKVFREGAQVDDPLTSLAQSDEKSYFVGVKRIRVSTKNGVTGEMEKKEANIHLDCMKQLDTLKKKARA